MRGRLKLYSWLYSLGWLVLVPVLMTVLLGGFVQFDGGPTASALAPPRERIALLLPPAPQPPAAARPGPMLPSPETQLVAVPARFFAPGARPQLVTAAPRVRPRSAGRRTLRSQARRRTTGLGTQFALQPLPADPGGSTTLRSVTPGGAPAPTAPVQGASPQPAPAQGDGKPDKPVQQGNGKPDKPAQQGSGKPDKPAQQGSGKPDKSGPGGGSAPPAAQGKPEHAQGGGQGKPDDPGRNGRGKP